MSPTSFVAFNGDTRLAARIHRSNADLTVRQPAVIVTGSWLTVKEQMADLYAAALAERGYTAITFDFAGFGASGGTPRQLEAPARKIRDIKAVVDAVSTLSFVQPGGPGYLAICASAQYALAAIAQGAGIASFAAVAGWFHDLATVTPFYGGPDGIAARLVRATEATDHYLATGDVRTVGRGHRHLRPQHHLDEVPAYRAGDDRAGMFLDMDYYANPARGNVPTWINDMAEMTWHHWLTFDGLSAAASVATPTMLVHSDGSVLPDNVRTVARNLRGPADIIWGEGSQTDFYDQPAQVGFAVDAVDAHFQKTLGQLTQAG
jgi:fermentation-respiration switch protein FrsA (DUF1100 family)